MTKLTLDERKELVRSIEKDVKTFGAVCFFHCDNDGRFANQVVKNKFPSVRCYSTNHHRRVQYEVIPPRSVVFIVDFSFPLEDMKRLARDHRVIWCDHHDVIGSYVAEGFECEGNCRIEPGTAGCSLVWELLYPELDRPRSLDLVAKYDTWQIFDDPNVIDFNLGLSMINLEPMRMNDDNWKMLFTSAEFCDRLILAGQHIKQFDITRSELMAEQCAFLTDLDGIPAMAINVKNTNSKVLDSAVANYHGEKPLGFRVLFSWFANINQYRISVYSEDETQFDAAAYCRQYNGDGRASAAGCVSKELPFKLPEAKDDYVFEYRDYLEPVRRLSMQDALVRKYCQLNMKQSVGSLHAPKMYLGYKCSFINHPGMLIDAWYDAGLNFHYDLGVFHYLMGNGWYKLVIHPLNPDISLTEIEKRSGGKISGETVVVYQKKNPLFQ